MPLVLVCHIMPAVSSMAPLHLLGQDDQYKVQHDGHVMPLVPMLASYEAIYTVTGTLGPDDQTDVKMIFGHVTPTASPLV